MVYDSYGVMNTDSGSVLADYVTYTGREAERYLGIYFYRSRYYDPLTGRFMVRDLLGLSVGDVNLYRYVGNNPVSLRDPAGLLGKGIEEGGDYLGHSDLYWGNRFDFTREDRNILTTWWQPFGGIQRHFRNLPDVERDLMIAIADRDLVLFESLMHQGQDYFSHYSQGYRWYPTSWNDLPGHAEDGTMPDRNIAAWERANCWTTRWVEIWFAAYER
ncbi:MAG: RHS repeat-associated core domain-containing protein [Candidatus Zixiibacteriota bacterium]|nr:MAG: RHS repeat-associated core domain-containing protein [candidate division Zixibacteria bacterium]